jgi:hypothetical protein
MKKRRTVIKHQHVAQISTEQTQVPNQIRKMSNPSSPSAQLYDNQPRKQSTPNEFGRPNNGTRRPSLTDLVSTPVYEPNYVAQVALNMEPALGPGSYYADSLYSRQRRRGSDSDNQRGNGNRSRQGSNPFPDERFDGPVRSRQGSIANSDDRLGQSSPQTSFDYRNPATRPSPRKNSSEDGYYRARKPSAPDNRTQQASPQYIAPGSSYPEYLLTPQPLQFYDDYRGEDRRTGSIDRTAQPHQRQPSFSTPNSPRRGPPGNTPRQRFATTEEVRQDDRYRTRPVALQSRSDELTDGGRLSQRRPSEVYQRRPSWEDDRGYREGVRSKTPNNEYQSVSARVPAKTVRPHEVRRGDGTLESRRVDEGSLGEFLSNVLADCEDFLGMTW